MFTQLKVENFMITVISSRRNSTQAHYFSLKRKAHYQRDHSALIGGFKLTTSTVCTIYT